jgi:small-conductance mechanosensitive channel
LKKESPKQVAARLIKFPNEKVLNELIYNYSWPLFPYIWNEVNFQVAYNADLEFIASTHPRVIFRVGENTWLEAIVRYLVAPREAGRVKTRLIKKLLAALNAAPDKVMFPAGANR